MQIEKSKNEEALMAEQDTIKKYLKCVAVYDIPAGYEANVFRVDNEYKLFIYKLKE